MVNNRRKMYRSISEIEEMFFPKSAEEKLSERSSDPATLGIFLAEESLIKIRNQLR